MNKAPARLLVVDDEKLIRWSIGLRFERRGYEIHHAESGEDALRQLPDLCPSLMILDVRLPGIDGVATLTRAQEIQPGIPTIMMSAHSTADIIDQAMRIGARAFLVKPFSLELLEAAVDRLLWPDGERRPHNAGPILPSETQQP